VEEGSSFDANHKHETREMFTSWKGEGTTVVQDFREVLSKEYVDFTFTDHVKLTADAETGWRIDLNGDGVKEEICIYKKEDVLPYLCINGYGVIALDQLFACCWLLDIDTTDGMYEILTDEGGLMVYDGEKLNMPWVLKYYTFGDGCTFHGTLAEFKRVDEHTISYVDIVEKEFLYYEMKEIQARLDSNHALYYLEQANGEETVIAEFDSKYEYPGEPFRLYSEKDETSSYVEVKALPDSEIIRLTDEGSNWFYVTTRDNGSGWILYGEHDRIDSFLQQMEDTTAEDWEDSRWNLN